jgi:PHD/YefM family antitoxin component YafN of YafNO toxin-antitoxin module
MKNEFKTIDELRDTLDVTLEQLKNNARPIVILKEGNPLAVILNVNHYQQLTSDYETITGVLQGLKDVREGRTLSYEELKHTLISAGKLDPQG